jgi:hypothetical protein
MDSLVVLLVGGLRVRTSHCQGLQVLGIAPEVWDSLELQLRLGVVVVELVHTSMELRVGLQPLTQHLGLEVSLVLVVACAAEGAEVLVDVSVGL